ncbi:MAG: C-GCAxxG-C-C family (seleno)protein [Bacillota bacterium]|nr:C-GCAxxG-C-C family (seleno)protein [Bacillota bacterium]
MSVTAAKNNYMGANGYKRMNCAQSVLSAFKEKFGIEDDLVDAFSAYGGGRAPDGLCGAYYAVKFIIDRYDKENVEKLNQYFLEQAGALECTSIRSLRKLSCIGCIEKSAEFLEKLA